MTWLSEIIRRMRLKIGYASRLDLLRTARIIRELSAYIKASHAVEEACLEFNPVDIGKLNNDRLNAWDNLSVDAKELLE